MGDEATAEAGGNPLDPFERAQPAIRVHLPREFAADDGAGGDRSPDAGSPRSNRAADVGTPRPATYFRGYGRPRDVAHRMVVRGIPDPGDAMEILLGVAEAAGASGFQSRALPGALEVLIDCEDGLVEDLAGIARGLWPGSEVHVEPYARGVMDLEMFKRVLYTRDHPEEIAGRRGATG